MHGLAELVQLFLELSFHRNVLKLYKDDSLAADGIYVLHCGVDSLIAVAERDVSVVFALGCTH